MFDRCSIIAVSYNSEKEILELSAGLEEGFDSSRFELLLVSNSGVPEHTLIDLPHKWLIAESNLGFGRACNLAVRSATGEVMAFINPDVRITCTELKKLIQCLNVNENIPAAVPTSDSDNYSCRQLYVTNHEIGSCFVIDRAYFDSIGRFDESFFLYFEDTDLRDRIQRDQACIRISPDVPLRHHAGHATAAGGMRSKKMTRVWVTSRTYYRHKNFGLLTCLRYACIDAAKDLLRCVLRKESRIPFYKCGVAVWFQIRCVAWSIVSPDHLKFNGINYGWERS